MARGRKTSLTIRLTPAERQTLLVATGGRPYPGWLGPTWPDYFAPGRWRPDHRHCRHTVGISRRFIYKWAWRFLGRASRNWPTNPAVAPDAGSDRMTGEMNPPTWM